MYLDRVFVSIKLNSLIFGTPFANKLNIFYFKGFIMSSLSSKSTSNFSVNVPQSVLFSENLVSLSQNKSRLEEIEFALEGIFGVEKLLTTLQSIQVHNMHREIDKINQKYVTTNRIMIEMDVLRVTRFQERIEAIYAENEPTKKEFIYAESLLQEKERLLVEVS